jgi:hypothetical protein
MLKLHRIKRGTPFEREREKGERERVWWSCKVQGRVVFYKERD